LGSFLPLLEEGEKKQNKQKKKTKKLNLLEKRTSNLVRKLVTNVQIMSGSKVVAAEACFFRRKLLVNRVRGNKTREQFC